MESCAVGTFYFSYKSHKTSKHIPANILLQTFSFFCLSTYDMNPVEKSRATEKIERLNARKLAKFLH